MWVAGKGKRARGWLLLLVLLVELAGVAAGVGRAAEGSSQCVNQATQQPFTLVSSLVTGGGGAAGASWAGRPGERESPGESCFEHEMAESSGHFQAGDVWRFCVLDGSSAGFVSPSTATTSNATFADETEYIAGEETLGKEAENIDAVELYMSSRGAQNDDWLTDGEISGERDDLQRWAEQSKSSAINTPSVSFALSDEETASQSFFVTVTVNSGVPDSFPNMSSCDPTLQSTPEKCSLRSAVAYCESVLSSMNVECVISLPSMEQVFIDDAFGGVEVRNRLGHLRIEGNGGHIVSSSSTANSTLNLLQVNNNVLTQQLFSFFLSNVIVSGFGGDTVDGGALYIRGAAITLTNVTFIDNMGLAGGALCIDEDCVDVVIESCRFLNNTALSAGGAVYVNRENYFVNITSCDFTGNIVVRGGKQSAIGPGVAVGGGLVFFINNHHIVVSNCSFDQNMAYIGGAVSFETGNTDITFWNNVIVGNRASGVGGVEFYLGNTGISVENCMFRDNAAERESGALRFFDGNWFVYLVNCSFHGNRALYDGGACTFGSSHIDITIQDCIFERNLIVSGGRAAGLYIANTNTGIDVMNCKFHYNMNQGGVGGGFGLFYDNEGIVISNCSFIGNSVLTGNGGGLFIDTGNDDLVLRDNWFNGNSVGYGFGGGLVIHSQNVGVLCERLIFIGNSAGENGGALAFVTGNLDAVIRDCTFSNNSAGTSGGGLYSAFSNSGMSIKDCVFACNVASLYGGAVYFGEQHDGTLVLLNSTLNNNHAEEAGAIFVFWFNEKILIDGCIIQNNFATVNGGAMRAIDVEVAIENTTVEGNVAGQDFGGVFIDDSEAVNMLSVKFINNTSLGSSDDDHFSVFHSGGGGGLAVTYCSNVAIEKCLFERNEGHQYGGAMYLVYSDIVMIRDTIIRGNSAIDGGACNIYESTVVLLVGLVLEANVAEENGAGLYVDESSNVDIVNSSFVSNEALRGFGSAIFLNDAPTSLWGNSFDANRAPHGAGTLFWVYNGGMGEPFGIIENLNNFTDSNYALYGNLTATNGMRIIATGSTISNMTDVIYINNYGSHIPVIETRLEDYYDQIVVTESQDFSRLSIPSDAARECNSVQGFIGGGVLEQFKKGIAIFHEVDAVCAPGGKMDVEVTSVLALNRTSIELDFRFCIVGEYVEDRKCLPCENGTYSFTDPTDINATDLGIGICKSCPSGADHCYADQIVVSKGHWRINSIAESIHTCPWGEESCSGGYDSGDTSCAALYRGPLCAVCIDDHFYVAASGTCEPCENTAAWFDPFTVAVLVVFVLGTVLAVYMFEHTMRERDIQSFDELCIYIVLKMKWVDMDTYVNAPLAVNESILILKRKLGALAKMYITFFQVVTAIPSVLHYDEFPPGFKSHMLELNSIVNLGISRSAIFTCTMGSSFDFVDKLLLETISPAVVMSLLVIGYQVHVRLLLGKVENGRDSKYLLRAAAIGIKYVQLFLFFTYLILPSLIVTIFETFSCNDIDPDGVDDGDDHYLRADYRISCHSSQYRFAQTWAILMIFVYVLGVPLFYFYLLYTKRNTIQRRLLRGMLVDNKDKSQEEQELSAIRILFDSYKPQYWYWELVETVFRMSMTGFLVLGAYAGNNAQIILGLVVAVVFVKLYEHCDPFLDSVCQSSKVVSLWEICVIYFLLIVMKEDFIDESTTTAFAYSLVVVVLLNLVLGIYYIFRQFIGDTSASRSVVLSLRDRCISNSSESEGRQQVTSVVFSPFDVDGKLARKELKV